MRPLRKKGYRLDYVPHGERLRTDTLRETISPGMWRGSQIGSRWWRVRAHAIIPDYLVMFLICKLPHGFGTLNNSALLHSIFCFPVLVQPFPFVTPLNNLVLPFPLYASC